MVGAPIRFSGAGTFSGQGFRVEFQRPDAGPYEQLSRDAVAIRGASIEAVVKTTEEVKDRIRDYIDAHFSGSMFHGNGRRRVSNASAQSKFYDEVEEKGQYAGLVYSKFGKRDGGGFVDFLLLHVRGGTVKPKKGNWLKIANPEAGSLLGAQSGFFSVSQSDIFFTRSGDGKKLFLRRRFRRKGKAKDATQLLATLVRSVSFPARLSGVEEIARQRPALFEGYFAQALKLQMGEF